MQLAGTLSDRYAEVRGRVERAAARSGRSGSDVLVVAVCKHAEPDQIRELIRLGQVDFGENRVQQLVQRAAMIDEWLARYQTLPGAATQERHVREGAEDYFAGGASAAGGGALPARVRWHMIGTLQRNKARKVVDCCRLIHSVESLRLAEELYAIGARRERPIEVLVQVNIAGEKSKHGCALAAALHLAEQIDSMIHVKVRGLMTMAPESATPEEARPVFARLHDLYQEIRRASVGAPDFNILSMGMSGDFEVAIEEGANLVRVGTAIFGESAHADDEGDEEGED